jgi:hypothetical protein
MAHSWQQTFNNIKDLSWRFEWEKAKPDVKPPGHDFMQMRFDEVNQHWHCGVCDQPAIGMHPHSFGHNCKLGDQITKAWNKSKASASGGQEKAAN